MRPAVSRMKQPADPRKDPTRQNAAARIRADLPCDEASIERGFVRS